VCPGSEISQICYIDSRILLRLLGPLTEICGLVYMNKVSEGTDLFRLMCVINIPNDFPVHEVRHGVFGNLE